MREHSSRSDRNQYDQRDQTRTQKGDQESRAEKQVTRPQAPAPFKGFDTALSGIDLGMLGLDDGQGRDLDDRLLGKTGNAVMTADLVDVPPKPITRGALNTRPQQKERG